MKAQPVSDLGNAELGVGKKPLGIEQPPLPDDAARRLLGFRTDDIIQVIRAHAQLARVNFERAFLPEMPFDGQVKLAHEPGTG